jgi:hypothetical protein
VIGWNSDVCPGRGEAFPSPGENAAGIKIHGGLVAAGESDAVRDVGQVVILLHFVSPSDWVKSADSLEKSYV